MENKEDYYSIKKLSNSALSHFKESPKHYLHYIGEGNKAQPTSAMVLGQAVHCYILEPDKFETTFAIEPKCDKRTTAGKLIASEFEAKSKGMAIITENELELVKQLKIALYECEPANEYMKKITQTEKEIFWTDEKTGIELKGKLDAIGDNIIIDLKTCQSAAPAYFASVVINNDYNRQAALYIDGCKANGININNFYFIAIEKDRPYGVSVNRCSDELIELGRKQYQDLLDSFKIWTEQGRQNIGYDWKSPFGTFEISLPNWMKK